MVESRVSVSAGLVWHGSTRPVDVCFPAGELPLCQGARPPVQNRELQKQPDIEELRARQCDRRVAS